MSQATLDGWNTQEGKVEELKRTSRVLTIVLMIATAPKRYLRKHLVEHFELSPRMIDKDLEIIRHGLRLPLAKDKAGYYFERMPDLPMLRFGFAEALALLTAVQSAQRVSGVGTPELAAAVLGWNRCFQTNMWLCYGNLQNHCR